MSNKKTRKTNKTKKEEKTFEGTLSITKYGYGFVDISKRNGIYVSEKNLNGGFFGDTVRAKLIKKGKKPECKVVRVVKRNISSLTGFYHKENTQAWFVPLDSKIPFIFKIKHFNPEINFMLSEGDIITGEILSYGTSKTPPTIYISEFLGRYDDKGNDMLIVMKKYGISESFPENVLCEAENFGNITENDLEKRIDLTNETIVTIDGDDAKDLDDAVNVLKTPDGYTLGVHIADVSHYVKANSELDKESFKRGTSVYFPDRVAPMLPKKLSNGLCSLNPDEIKLTFSCIIDFDNNGNVVDYRLQKSFIKSKARLTYEVVRKIVLEEFDEETRKFEHLKKEIMLMYELYKILRKKRENDGFVEFNFPEPKFLLNENGKAVDVFPYPLSFSNEIIEEFMLSANVCVADFALKNNLPFVYRIHGEPDREKIEGLYKMLDTLEIKRPHSHRPTPPELNEILKSSQDTQYEPLIHQITLRTMQKAVYFDECIGHYGLNFKKYCHFTSPIRRYPDLMIHRILSDYLELKSTKRYNKAVKNIAEQSSEREINAFLAERDANDIKKAQYMEEHLGERFEGIISGMCETGFFVELKNTVEGFVPLATIKGDFYKFYEDEFLLRGKKSKNVFRIGQKVKIIVDKCDVPSGKIDFYLDN